MIHVPCFAFVKNNNTIYMFILEIYGSRNSILLYSIFNGSVAETDSFYNSFDSLGAYVCAK